jgi:hypothetical protein
MSIFSKISSSFSQKKFSLFELLAIVYSVCGGVAFIFYLFVVVFYCGASKTINLSLQVEEIHQTFGVTNFYCLTGATEKHYKE